MTKSNWDLKLETVLMGYRCSRQETIKRSPYYMLFQKEMRLSIDREMQKLYSLNSENEVQEVIQGLLESRGKLFDKTSLKIYTTMHDASVTVQYLKSHKVMKIR